jgi:saxitoxin biosynthesis operon SxtJ-like protein
MDRQQMTDSANTHESFARNQAVKGSSDRAFGVVFTVLFVVIGLLPLFSGGAIRVWSVAVGAAILAVALVRPSLLAPFNRAWMKFGLLLHKITNPIVMGLIFFGAVTPTALIMRALGKDPLRRRFDPSAPSYWIERDPPGPEPDTMKQQF